MNRISATCDTVEIWLDDLPNGLPRKDWTRRVRVTGLKTPRFYLTNEIKSFRGALKHLTTWSTFGATFVRKPGESHAGVVKDGALIRDGAWSLDLVVYHKRSRRTVQGYATEAPLIDLDSDACLEAVRDGLEAANILDDDVRIRGDRTTTVLRKAGPAMFIRLRRIADMDAWLSERVPNSDLCEYPIPTQKE